MRLVLLAVTLTMLGCRESTPVPTTEAGRVLADIRRLGRDSIASRVGRDDAFGDPVLKGIGSGDSTWLEVAVALRGTGNADVSESLPISVAQALPRAPERVLSLVQRKEFSTDEVCTIPFIEPTDSVVGAYYGSASTALRTVKRADMSAERDRCQAALDHAHGAASAQVAPVRAGTRILEQHHIDMDDDGVADDLVVWSAAAGDPGVADRIELRLSHAGTRVLQDSNRWDPPPDDFKGTHNLVHSRLLYVAAFPKAGRLLFLFGANVACCLQNLTIYKLSASGPQKYFHAENSWYYSSPNPGSSGAGTMALKSISEGMAPPTPEFVRASTYDPIIVYRLGEHIEIDSTASEALNRKALGGFAGLKSRSDVRAVVRRDSTRALWDDRAGRIIP